MPELPEVETVCQTLAPHLINKTLVKATINNGSLRYKIEPNKINLFIAKQKIKKLYRRAKYIILVFYSNQGLCMHLGMTGSFRITQKDIPYLKHEHISFLMDDCQELRYCDPRRFGFITTFNDVNNIPMLKKLGPEPLERGFTPKYIYQAIKNKKQPIKNLLMNNQFVVGIGNIYASESLFLANISPLRPSSSLTLKDCQKLHENIRLILYKAIEAGGSTIKDYKSPDGKEGYFTQQLNVYGQEKKPCNKCHTPINKKTMAGRSSFFCPSCQQ